MASNNFLDKSGLGYLWGKITNKITTSEANITAKIPKKTSQLENDSNFAKKTDIPAPSQSRPKGPTTSDILGIIGTGKNYAREDHQHPKQIVQEAEIKWGGGSIKGNVTPIDAAMMPMIGYNKTDCAKPAGITVEYSNDAGATWVDYGLSDKAKSDIVSVCGNSSVFIGGGTSSTQKTLNDKLRITVNAKECGTYTSLKKILIEMSSNGATNTTVLIEKAKGIAPTEFSEVGTYSITGWSGWNSIDIGQIYFGGGDEQNIFVLRFTFSIGGLNAGNYKSALQIMHILFLGITNWNAPSAMARIGHLYTYDVNQNAEFPANVRAATFTGSANGLTSTFDTWSVRDNIASGNNLTIIFSKIRRMFADLKGLAFKDKVDKTDLSDAVQASLDKADANAQAVATKVSKVITEIPKGRMRGDVDGDGKITENDEDQINKHINAFIILTGADLWCADITGDNDVYDIDAVQIGRYLAGKTNVLTVTPTFADYYNNWIYHKVDNTSGYWTTELSIPAITTEMGVSIICGKGVRAGTFIKAEPFAGGVRIYANYPPIEAVPCEVNYSTGAGGQIIIADTDISEAQKYVTEHNQSGTAHLDIRTAVAGSVRYDAAQTLTDEQKAQARGNINSAPGGFGLGGIAANIPAGANLNDYILTGFFGNANTSAIKTWVNVPPNWPANEAILEVYSLRSYLIQRLSSVSTRVSAQRSLISNAWTEWEWVNPPMQLGVEYRTTERYLGKPVYVKVVNFGALPNNTEASVTFGDATTQAFAVTARILKNASSYTLPILDQAVVWAGGATVYIKTTDDYSAWTGVVTVKYTKTTD